MPARRHSGYAYECVWSVCGVLVESLDNTPHTAKPLYIVVSEDWGEW